MTRYCPYCGVAVPSNCITCPKCYKSLPREDDGVREDGQNCGTGSDTVCNKGRSECQFAGNDRIIMLILAIVPAFFGVLGLAQIYRDCKDGKGYFFLLVGLVFFIPSVLLITNVWNTGVFVGVFRIVAYIILTLIYLSTALGSVIDALFGSVRAFKY